MSGDCPAARLISPRQRASEWGRAQSGVQRTFEEFVSKLMPLGRSRSRGEPKVWDFYKIDKP